MAGGCESQNQGPDGIPGTQVSRTIGTGPGHVGDAVMGVEEGSHDGDPGYCLCKAALKRDRCVRKVRNFNEFVDHTLAGLPPTAAVLWWTLLRYEKNGRAKVCQATLASRMGIDVKTVRRNLKILLAKQGLLKIVKQGAKGKGCSVYRLGLRKLASRAKSKQTEACDTQSEAPQLEHP